MDSPAVLAPPVGSLVDLAPPVVPSVGDQVVLPGASPVGLTVEVLPAVDPAVQVDPATADAAN